MTRTEITKNPEHVSETVKEHAFHIEEASMRSCQHLCTFKKEGPSKPVTSNERSGKAHVQSTDTVYEHRGPETQDDGILEKVTQGVLSFLHCNFVARDCFHQTTVSAENADSMNDLGDRHGIKYEGHGTVSENG